MDRDWTPRSQNWIQDHSALNRFFFAYEPPSGYAPDPDRFFYLGCDSECGLAQYSICCSWILPNGDRVGVETILDGSVPVIIFCEGTCSNIDSCARFVQRLACVTQCHVVVFDYPGYGLSLSPHYPNESSACRAVEVVLDHVLTQMGVPIQNIVLAGHSLGTAVATYGARYAEMKYGCPVGGLMLMNPFLSLRKAGESLTIVGCLISERLNTEAWLLDCHCPLLIMHGHQDTVVPIQHGQSLYKQCTSPKMAWFPADGTHDHCDLSLLYQKMAEFISTMVHIRPTLLRGVNSSQTFEFAPYINVTPRTPLAIHSQPPSLLTQVTATTLEVSNGIANDFLTTCYPL